MLKLSEEGNKKNKADELRFLSGRKEIFCREQIVNGGEAGLTERIKGF